MLDKLNNFQLFFPIHFNDLHDFINSSHVQSLPTISEMFETKLNYLPFCTQITDDTVLLAESSDDIQKNLITSISIAENKI